MVVEYRFDTGLKRAGSIRFDARFLSFFSFSRIALPSVSFPFRFFERKAERERKDNKRNRGGIERGMEKNNIAFS